MSTNTARRDGHAAYAAEHGLGTARWRALGTSVHLLCTDPARLSVASAIVTDVLDDVDRALSRFRADSELRRLENAAGRWSAVSPLFARALRVALDAAAWTDGQVDPTLGQALRDLGYDRTFTEVTPDGPAVTVAHRPRADWRSVELDDSDPDRARVRVPVGVGLDLGATAKGFAADLAATAAADRCGAGVLVNLGGDLCIAGPVPGHGWAVTVTDSSDPDGPVTATEQTVVLHGGGLATSSVTARRWRRGGSVLHHLLDPRSGQPVHSPWRTVSVAASTATLANTASTAAVVLGAEAPGWLTDRGFAARLVDTVGTIRYLGGWPHPTAGAAAPEGGVPCC